MTDDSDPPEWPNIGIEDDTTGDITIDSVNTERVNVEGHVPIEELEALADEFERDSQKHITLDDDEEATEYQKGESHTFQWCAQELRPLIAEYRGASDE